MPKSRKNSQKWYQKDVWIIILLIFFFPIGLFLMWKHATWSDKAKWIVTAAFGVYLIWFFATVDTESVSQTNDDKKQEETAQQDQADEEVAQEPSTPEDLLAQWKKDPGYSNPKTVPYAELFRNAEKHRGQFVRMKGEVIQVLGEPGNWNLRVNVTEKGDYGYVYYDDTVFVFSYDQERVIEKDIIVFTAQADGTQTYESALGSEVTIPSLITFDTRVVGRQE